MKATKLLTLEEADLADRLIGAADALEKGAKSLKEQAKTIRRWGVAGNTELKLWVMHKHNDVEQIAKNAALELDGHEIRKVQHG